MASIDDKRGFTLIELLVVIAIIGTLASTVLVAVQDARNAARDAQVKRDIKSIQTALEMYRNANNGNYPAGGAIDLDTLVTSPNDIRPYINPIPTNPNPKFVNYNEYRYWRNATDAGSYVLLAKFSHHADLAGLANYCQVSVGPNPPSWSSATPCF